MSERKSWFLVAYDVREPKRWRKLYKLLRGYGTRLQYSVFRCWLSERQMQKLRWDVEKRIDAEDAVLFVGLCEGCVRRIVSRNRAEAWDQQADEQPFRLV